jgi:hypothetical protein
MAEVNARFEELERRLTEMLENGSAAPLMSGSERAAGGA